MKNPTTAFLFDIGNVIIRFDFRLAIGRVADRCTLAPEHILPNLQPLTDQLDMGQLGVLEFVEAAAEVTGFSGTPEEFIAAFEDIFELNQPIADLIEKLSEAKTPLFLLSNTNAIHVPFFTKKFPVFAKFDGAIYSYESGCMKPAPKIFEIAIKKLGLEAGTTIYIDDLPANCEAGKKAGFQTFCYDFRNHDALLAAIKSPV